MLTCIPGAVICAFIKIGSYSEWTGPDVWVRTDEIVMMHPFDLEGEGEVCVLRVEAEDRPILASNTCERLAERIAANR